MKRKRHSVEQIVTAVKQHEAGMPAAEIIRKLGIADQAFYLWKQQYGGLEASEVRELKQLRDENAKLKKLVAGLSLDRAMLQDISSKKWCAHRNAGRRCATCNSDTPSVSAWLSGVTGSARILHRYQSIRPPQAALRGRIRGLAESRVRYGYRRIHILLKREVIHLYCEEGLQLRTRRPRRHVTAATRQPTRSRPRSPNVAWSMDCISGQMVTCERFRALTVVDVFTRECLAIKPGKSLGAADVVSLLSGIVSKCGASSRVHCDKGSEFAERLVDCGLCQQGHDGIFKAGQTD